MIRKLPLAAQIEAKINNVVRLLREEAEAHPKEHWEEPCRRVAETVGVSVTLLQFMHDWVAQDVHAHGNLHLRNGLRDCYVAVSHYGDNWRVVFKLWDWTLPNDVRRKQTDVEDEAHSTAIAKAPDTGGSPAADKPPPSPAAAGASRPNAHHDDVETAGSGASPMPSRSRPADRRKSPAAAAPPIFNEARLIREFDRRERDRGPIFAGFIVNDLLPRMGFNSADAKRILRAMEAQDMVHTEQKQNPNQPERTTSFVTLNRAHPHVVRILTGVRGDERTFPIGTIDGELLSERIIRERR